MLNQNNHQYPQNPYRTVMFSQNSSKLRRICGFNLFKNSSKIRNTIKPTSKANIHNFLSFRKHFTSLINFIFIRKIRKKNFKRIITNNTVWNINWVLFLINQSAVFYKNLLKNCEIINHFIKKIGHKWIGKWAHSSLFW